jgi:hypothetical protein
MGYPTRNRTLATPRRYVGPEARVCAVRAADGTSRYDGPAGLSDRRLAQLVA